MLILFANWELNTDSIDFSLLRLATSLMQGASNVATHCFSACLADLIQSLSICSATIGSSASSSAKAFTLWKKLWNCSSSCLAFVHLALFLLLLLLSECAKEKQSKGKNESQQRKHWRDVGPEKGTKPDRCEDGTPTCKKNVKGRDYEWCAKCDDGQGRWTTAHNTVNHEKNFNQKGKGESKENNDTNGNHGEANVVERTCGLQPTFLMAEHRAPKTRPCGCHPINKNRSACNNKRHSSKRFGQRHAHRKSNIRPTLRSYPRPVSPSPPPSPMPWCPKYEHNTQDNKPKVVHAVTTIGVMSFIKSLGIDWKFVCNHVIQCFQNLWASIIQVNYIKALHKFSKVSSLIIAKGKDIMEHWCSKCYKLELQEEIRKERRQIRRCQEQWQAREYGRMKRQLTQELNNRLEGSHRKRISQLTHQHNKLKAQTRIGNHNQTGNTSSKSKTHTSNDLWFQDRAKAMKGRSRVSFNREWATRYEAMRKANRDRELLELQAHYREYANDPKDDVSQSLKKICIQAQRNEVAVRRECRRLDEIINHKKKPTLFDQNQDGVILSLDPNKPDSKWEPHCETAKVEPLEPDKDALKREIKTQTKVERDQNWRNRSSKRKPKLTELPNLQCKSLGLSILTTLTLHNKS